LIEKTEIGRIIDVTTIMPNIVKSVTMSAPFLTETIRGKKVTYDDDIIKYRWFYQGLPGIGLEFVNDPTPMVEGSPGNGKGITIDVEFHIPSDNLVVLNGFVDLDRRHLYRANARMKTVKYGGMDLS